MLLEGGNLCCDRRLDAADGAGSAVIVRPMKHIHVLLLLTACSPLTATWEGKCDYGEDEIQVELELIQDGEDVEGEGSLSYLAGNTLITVDVEVDGEKDGDDVELDLDTELLGTMEIDATLEDRSSLTGECEWGSEGVLTLDMED